MAWASPRAPWRIGVSFDEPYLGTTGHWFDLLVRAYPGLATFQLAPESLALAATVRLGPAVTRRCTGAAPGTAGRRRRCW